MSKFVCLVSVVALFVAAVACTPKPEQDSAAQAPTAEAVQKEAPAQGNSEAAAQAKTIFEQRCVMCHGATGQGDGVAAANLNPKPRNYSDPKWQASVEDSYLAKVIVEGGAAVGKSMLMPGNPDLKDKPEVVAELVKIVRGFSSAAQAQ